MRRPATAAALLAVALAAAGQVASTASSSVQSSTAVYRTTTVTGGTMRSISYTTAAGLITSFSVKLRGSALVTAAVLPKPVTAQFGSSGPVTCTPGVLTLLNALTGLREGTWTCVGFTESATRPRPLSITVG